jgi:SET domain-containing protein 6
MGSRVLSRSFTLSKEEEEDDHENNVDNSSLGSAMDIDPPHNGTTSANNSQEDNEEEGGEDEEETKVVMVPLADILNARYNTENVQPTTGFVICISDRLTMSSRLNSSMNRNV